MTKKKFPYFLSAARVLVGLLFIFSGFVKAVDPWGTAYKFEDYFAAANLSHINDAALLLSVLLSTSELLIGICLIVRLRMRFFAVASLLFMSFFTLLTFIIALTNPISDCGCFGEALKLGNWETFFKNLVFLPITLYIFINRKKYAHFSSTFKERVYTGIFFAYALGIVYYSYSHLPIIDFLPYHIGQNIPHAMSIPKEEEGNVDEYEITLVYEKEGVRHVFSQDSFMKATHIWTDTTWKFVETQNKLIKQGYQPPIKHLTLTNERGNSVLDSVLLTNKFFWVIIRKPEQVTDKEIEKLKKIFSFAEQNDAGFYLITSAALENVRGMLVANECYFPIYQSDDTELKSMMRTNVGVIYVESGTISGKWQIDDIPSFGPDNAIDAEQLPLSQNERNMDLLVTILIGIVLWMSMFSREALQRKLIVKPKE